ASIVQEGLHRMYGGGDQDPDVFYYITLYNEYYPMPAMPEGDPAEIRAAIMRGLYRWSAAPEGHANYATLLFSGSAQGAARQAAAELAEHFDVGVELWSATSYKRLRENALEVERWNRLHPSQTPRIADVAQLLADSPGPVVAVTDFMKIVPEQVARFLPGRTFVPLGTDGMGRSDTRESLRRFFEIDLGHVVVGVLSALHAAGQVDAAKVEAAIRRYEVDPEAIDPYII
ncbi:MAG: transketolase-like TK C-terminal-containing protein, partial [Ilumatobacteraceae bacterium]